MDTCSHIYTREPLERIIGIVGSPSIIVSEGGKLDSCVSIGCDIGSTISYCRITIQLVVGVRLDLSIWMREGREIAVVVISVGDSFCLS